jgi:hypothetical protein
MRRTAQQIEDRRSAHARLEAYIARTHPDVQAFARPEKVLRSIHNHLPSASDVDDACLAALIEVLRPQFGYGVEHEFGYRHDSAGDEAVEPRRRQMNLARLKQAVDEKLAPYFLRVQARDRGRTGTVECSH